MGSELVKTIDEILKTSFRGKLRITHVPIKQLNELRKNYINKNGIEHYDEIVVIDANNPVNVGYSVELTFYGGSKDA